MTSPWCMQEPSAPAVLHADQEIVTFQQLHDLSHSLTAPLVANDLVALECSNNLAAVAFLNGTLVRRVPTLLVDAHLSGTLRSRLYSRFAVSGVYNAVEDRWSRLAPRGPRVHSDLQWLLSTSGSTGSPKLVRLSHENVLSNARQIGSYLGLNANSRSITVLPFQYSFGLSILTSHLLAGGSLAITDRSLMERSFWDFFKRSQADSISGVPTTFEQLRRTTQELLDVPSLRTLTQAGGRLNPSTAMEFAELAERQGWNLYYMYGQTEATARMAYLPPHLAKSKPNSIGKTIPEGRFELVCSNGKQILEANIPGELVYYGPNVMMGYAESVVDLAIGDALNGRLETGDLAQFDDDGHYSLIGRTSRFVKVNGVRIGLDYLESELQTFAPELAIAGEDGLILLAGTESDRLQEGANWLIDHFDIPRRSLGTIIMPSVPMGANGKILYRQILELYQSRHASHD